MSATPYQVQISGQIQLADLDALKAAGIRVWVWGWGVPDKWQDFADTMKEAQDKIRAVGIVANLEKPWFNRPQEAQLLAQADKYGDFIVDWHVVGPYAKGGNVGALMKAKFPPEEELSKVPWQKMPIGGIQGKPWMLDLTRACGNKHIRACYVQTSVYSPRDQAARLEAGVDDCIIIWLNDKKIHQNGKTGAAVPGVQLLV